MDMGDVTLNVKFHASDNSCEKLNVHCPSRCSSVNECLLLSYALIRSLCDTICGDCVRHIHTHVYNNFKIELFYDTICNNNHLFQVNAVGVFTYLIISWCIQLHLKCLNYVM